MSGFCINYFIYLSGFAIFFLTILSILSFTNLEALRIKKGKEKNSGILLLISAGVIYNINLILAVCNFTSCITLF